MTNGDWSRNDHDNIIRIGTTLENLDERLEEYIKATDTRLQLLEAASLSLQKDWIKADPINSHKRYDAWGKSFEALQNKAKGAWWAFTLLFGAVIGLAYKMFELYGKLYAFGLKP